MCTLVLAWRVFPEAPVVVAANRDEALDRPADPPARREFDGTAVVAPLDREAGGTWTGYNEHGLYVGLANRWVGGEGDAADATDRRSRGLLVRDLLAASSAEAGVEAVERAVERDAYDGFELVVADARSATLVEWDDRLRVTPLDPGVHVVVNVGAALGGGGVPGETLVVPPDRRAVAKRQADGARRLRDHLTPAAGERAEEWLDRAATALGDHEFGVCVHGSAATDDPPEGFGTRSSSLVRLGNERAYRFAEGPPCRTPHRPVDEQV